MARRNDHTRREIQEMALVAAETIVAQEGFNALSARRIAKAIGYTVGSLYLVFENLNDLILQINARTLNRLSNELEDVAHNCGTPRDRLHALGETYIAFASQNAHLWNLLFEHKLPPGGKLPDDMLKQVNRLFTRLEQQFTLLSPERTESPALIARALWSGVHGACTLSLSGKFDTTGVENTQSVVDTLISSLINTWCTGT